MQVDEVDKTAREGKRVRFMSRHLQEAVNAEASVRSFDLVAWPKQGERKQSIRNSCNNCRESTICGGRIFLTVHPKEQRTLILEVPDY